MKAVLSVSELTPKKKKTIMFVVFFLGLLQNFSSNMFNTTGTAIVADLSGVEYYTLQFTLFTLVSGIFIPLFGNLGDIQGRRRWLGIGTMLFAVGSVVMWLAPSMLVVLIGRVLASAAQAIMSANYLTLIGEISTEKERPMFMAINGAGIGVAQMLAPILAGFFVDNISWRLVFLFLTTLSIVSMFLVLGVIPTIKTAAMERDEKKAPDWAGGISLAIFGLAFLLVFTWGTSKGWGSPTLLALYVIAIIALISFIFFEKRGSNPLMPFHLFKYRGFTLGLIAMMTYGPACFTFSAYTAQIGVGVLGLSSTITGTFLTTHALGFLIFSFIWGKLISAKGAGALKPVQLICLLGLAVSMITFTFMRPGNSAFILYLAEFLGGTFNAALIVGFTQILQKEVPREYIGTGTSLLQFMMKLGGTLGISIGGMLMSSAWKAGVGDILANASSLGEDVVKSLSSSGTLLSTPGLAALRESVGTAGEATFDSTLASLRMLLSTSVSRIFWMAAILLMVSVILMAFVKNSKKTED